MRKRAIYLGTAVVLLACLGLVAQDEKPWFDMKNCEFCSNLCKNPHLLENMNRIWKPKRRCKPWARR